MRTQLAISLAVLSVTIAGVAGAHGGDVRASHHQSQVTPADVAALPMSASVRITNCWIRLLPAPAPSAGYFVIKNEGSSSVKLTGATTPAFGMTMLHQTTHEGGMSRMSMTHEVEIPAGDELQFKPGGYHAMFEQPTETVQVGANLPLTFVLDNGEKAEAQCEVKPANTLAP